MTVSGHWKDARNALRHPQTLCRCGSAQCYAVFRPAPACPRCGYEFPIQSREIEQVDGTLEQIDAVALAARKKIDLKTEIKKLARSQTSKPSGGAWGINRAGRGLFGTAKKPRIRRMRLGRGGRHDTDHRPHHRKL